jgi:plasmid segregation protein ParM
MIIAVDHGNVNIKAAGSGKVFTSGLRETDTRPPFGDDVLKYAGKYYALSDKRVPYLRDKTVDNRFYVLNLFAIAFEIEDRGCYTSDVMNVNSERSMNASRSILSAAVLMNSIIAEKSIGSK